jgi:hypothetical protein
VITLDYDFLHGHVPLHLVRLVLDRDKVDDVGDENSESKVDEQKNDANGQTVRENEQEEADQEEKEGDHLHK